MDKNQVIEIIKSHPEMDKDKLKMQASSAGVDEATFLEAWEEVNSGKKVEESASKEEKSEGNTKKGNSPSVGWIIKQSNALIKKHIVLFLLLIAIFILPFNIWTSLTVDDFFSAGIDLDSLSSGASSVAPQLFIILFTFFLTILVLSVVKLETDKSDINLEKVVKFGLNKFIPSLWTSIILFVLVTLLTILLIVPGIIFAVYWYFALVVVIFANVSGINALKESKKLVKGRWFLTVGNLILLGLVVIGVSIIFGLIVAGISFVGAFLPVTFDPYVVAIMNSFMVLVVVYGNLVMANFYLEMVRTNKS